MTHPNPRQLGTCASGMPRAFGAVRQLGALRQYGASCPAPTTRRGGPEDTPSGEPVPGPSSGPPSGPRGGPVRGTAGAHPPARPDLDARWPAHATAVRLPADGPGDDRAAFYRRIRDEHGPVAPVLLEGDVPAWLVLGYREVVYVAGTPALFGRDCRIWNAWDLVPPAWPLQSMVGQRPSLRALDGPAHARRLGAIGDVLGMFEPHGLRARAASGADALIDAMASDGRAELMTQYASPLPAMVAAGMWGLPDTDLTALARDLTLLVSGGTGARDARRRAHAMLTRVVRRRRAQPGDDAVSALLTHPAGLRDDEVVEDVMATLIAGQAPTADWIGNTLRLMLTDPRFATDLAGGRLSAGDAMAEVLWADPPIQNLVARWARRDVRLGGRWIRAGDLLIFGLSAANSDPWARPQPSGRPSGNHAHLAFGHGEHRCPFPAQMTAETIATTAIEVLLDRLPDLELAVEPRDLRWRPSVWARGVAALPVRFTPP
ncbi:putative cytochrome P450 [Parafrankia sp. EAN1pec]|uniref:cytochrome P450 n=1 Tax=Parafrankia sp. (strain EAN1pec) TaxID=298653 RepID=UPI00015DA081|nr:putative cytochrome P450 [Frankia sp. EAN1pec]